MVIEEEDGVCIGERETERERIFGIGRERKRGFGRLVTGEGSIVTPLREREGEFEIGRAHV